MVKKGGITSTTGTALPQMPSPIGTSSANPTKLTAPQKQSDSSLTIPPYNYNSDMKIHLPWMAYDRKDDGPRDPRLWNVEHTGIWLRNIGLEEYVEVFAEHCIDGDALFMVTEEELFSELGMRKIGCRKRLLRARWWAAHAFAAAKKAGISGSVKLQNAKAKLLAAGALSPRINVAESVPDVDARVIDPLAGNNPEWKQKELGTATKVSVGTITVIEVMMSVMKLHPFLHFLSLAPLLIGACTGVATWKKT